MIEELLSYYDRELTYFRHLADEFAARRGRAAARLRLETRDDPHVERLVQAFAMLNARVRHKLDDDFPELTEGLLQILYPHFLQPIPARGVVEFGVDVKSGGDAVATPIPRGTVVEARDVGGDRVHPFETAAPVTVVPIELASASLEPRPYQAPANPGRRRTLSVLKLEFRAAIDALRFDHLPVDRLRLHLHDAQEQNVHELYELLREHVIEIGVAAGPDREAAFSPELRLQPVGFDDEEALLAADPRTFPGYRLLSEFFALPEKFLFLDLVGLTAARREGLSDRMFVYVYLDRSSEDLAGNVSKDVVRLHCAPVVNRFRRTAEPQTMTQERTEYRVVGDNRNQESVEVVSVDDVSLVSPDTGEVRPVSPFYSVRHVDRDNRPSVFWYASQRLAAGGRSETYLAIVQMDASPLTFRDWTLTADVTCTSRGLTASALGYDGRTGTRLTLRDGRDGVLPAANLLRLKPAVAAPRRRFRLWRVISHLSLNHLALESGDAAVESLREMLRLHVYADESAQGSRPESKLVNSLVDVRARPDVARVGGVGSGFARGVGLQLVFDEHGLKTGQVYLLATLLERFLALYANVNSFTRLSARVLQRHEDGEAWTWPPRAGRRTLV